MRTQIGIGELDRVLGGGLVQGSVVLVGGDPGIGKSTLLLQVLGALGARLKSLYVSGEESARADRRARPAPEHRPGTAACAGRNLHRAHSGDDGQGQAACAGDRFHPDHLDRIADRCAGFGVAGARIRGGLVRYAKETGTSIFLVGHVTKEGGIAGPRVLEHMVDAVLYFEGEVGSRFRVLRAFKNRFGAVNELGVFAMCDKGLREVPNPSAIFLSAHAGPTPGSAVMVTREGTRPLLVEVQALVDQSSLGNPRRVALGLEQNRLAMLLAVLHRHGGMAVYDQDVFVNVVGGIRVQETAADLPVLLAVLSSFRDRPLPDKTVAFGEVGLSGEIRPVPNGEERLKEAATHGFLKAIVPRANAPKKTRIGDMEIVSVERLAEAIAAVI